MIAHVLVSKYLLGVPFYRLEQTFELQGFSLDRGTMSRDAEDVGATGVRIQPGPLQERKRGPCHKGHFFVVLADRDHIFFESQERHTSVAVCSMFKGYSGYLQADAHAVYDALFAGRPPVGRPPDPDQGPPPKEVGCWSHCRRGFWEAAVCKQALGVEGLRRIDAIFAAGRALADLPPATRKLRREERVRPLVDAFFAWVEAQAVVHRPRGYATSALGYARNQVGPLRRFLEDGRLRLENNGSERALRPVAAARKSWLFFGSDDHASAAANLFSLVASCKLHGLDPESYLADVIRVMPYWPRERYLELAPRYWADTRGRLDASELARPIGHVTVPRRARRKNRPRRTTTGGRASAHRGDSESPRRERGLVQRLPLSAPPRQRRNSDELGVIPDRCQGVDMRTRCSPGANSPRSSGSQAGASAALSLLSEGLAWGVWRNVMLTHALRNAPMPDDQPPAYLPRALATDPSPPESSVDSARRRFGGLLALLGGGAALASCSDADGAAAETIGRAVSASSGTTGLYRADNVATDLIGSAGTNGLSAANAGDIVVVNGYHTAGDGGGGAFFWRSGTPAAAQDDGLIVRPFLSGVRSTAGYWERIHDGELSILWFGAKPADASFNNATAIQAAIDAAARSNPAGGVVRFPRGLFHVATTLLLDASRAVGTVQGITLLGGTGGRDASLGSLVWNGTTASPILIIRGAANCRVERLNFFGGNPSTLADGGVGSGVTASNCIQVTTLLSGSEYSTSEIAIHQCTFAGANDFNLLLGEAPGSGSGNQDIQNVTISGCLFQRSYRTDGAAPATVAHIQQRGGNIAGTVVRDCRFVGSMMGQGITNTGEYYPLHAISIHSGWMKCFGISSGAIGFCDIYAETSEEGAYAAHLAVFGWESQSMNFFMSNVSAGVNGMEPVVFNGVVHSDVYPTPPSLGATFPSFAAATRPGSTSAYRFSIDYNNFTGQPLTLSGCVFSRDAVFRPNTVSASLHGVTFLGYVPGTYARPYGVVGSTTATEGSWLENGLRRNCVPNGRTLINPTSGVNQIEGDVVTLAAFGTSGGTDILAFGSNTMCGHLFVALSNGSGSVGGGFYLASALPTPVVLTVDPWPGYMNTSNPGSANGKVNVYWDSGQFKLRNGNTYPCTFRLSLVGFGTH